MKIKDVNQENATTTAPTPIPSDFYKGDFVMVITSLSELANVDKLPGTSHFKVTTNAQQRLKAQPFLIVHTCPEATKVSSALNQMSDAQRETILTTLNVGSLPFSTLEDISANSIDFNQNHMTSGISTRPKLQGTALIAVLTKNQPAQNRQCDLFANKKPSMSLD